MKFAVLIAVLLVTLLVVVPAFATNWVINPANGHQYGVITGNPSWSNAESQAVGLGGHLVTINDSAENEWLRTNFGQFDFMWIGFTAEHTGDFHWVSGEPTTYLNWGPGEGGGGADQGEPYAAMMGPNYHDGQWADLSTPWPVYTGVVMIGVAEVVPEPSSLLALGGGLIGLFGLIRRRA